MQDILIYGDSLTWGIIPMTRKRFPFHERWPGVMENKLNASGRRVRVIEDCLNGRRTVLDDPFKAGRNGIVGLAQRIEIHSPLALVILMLGTNDLQSMHAFNAWHASQGIAALVDAIRKAPIEPGMPAPPILVVAPPAIQNPRGPLAPKFMGGDAKCIGLPEAYRETAKALGCSFFNAGTATSSSNVDGIHLDLEQHLALGEAITPLVTSLISL